MRLYTKFNDDKKSFENWKASFNPCIDQSPATAEYKLFQLRQYLCGDALKAIEGFEHSSFAYEAAKERLERKYGGTRRCGKICRQVGCGSNKLKRS